jgi:hypothetical protein
MAQVKSTTASKSTKPGAKGSLVLQTPTSIHGTVDSTLTGGVTKNYQSVEIWKARGQKPHAFICGKNGTDPTKIGSSMRNFFMALVNAAYAGKGVSPDGSALWVAENWDAVKAHAPKLGSYRVICIPDGRSGAAKYEGTVTQLVQIALAKAAVIAPSLEAHGIGKSQARKAAPVVAEKVEVNF